MATAARPQETAAGAAPHSPEAEIAVLGAVLLSSKCFPALRLEEGLEAAHFYRDKHRAIFEAMCELHGRGDEIDTLTVAAELERRGILKQIGGRAAIDVLTGGVPMLGAYRTYAGVVTKHWRDRERLSAARAQEAVILNHGSEEEYQAALQRAHAVVASGVADGFLEPYALADHVEQWLEEDGEEAFPTPPELSSLGRMVLLQPGHVTLVAAWPSSGKSAMALALARAIGSQGHRVGIWTNEETRVQLAAKHVQSVTGIPSTVITRRQVRDPRMPQVLKELARLPFVAQPCAGWSAEQVATHMTQAGLPVAILDHFHNLKGISDVGEIDESLRVLVAAARRAGTHLIICAQLNRNRLNGVCKPPPVVADLRGSASFEFNADTILLVHIDQVELEDEGGGKLGKAVQVDTGSVDVAKNKITGETGVITVQYDKERIRFIEPVRGAASDPDAWLR